MKHRPRSARVRSMRARPPAPGRVGRARGGLGLATALAVLGCLPLEDLSKYSRGAAPAPDAAAPRVVITSSPERPARPPPRREPRRPRQPRDGGPPLTEDEGAAAEPAAPSPAAQPAGDAGAPTQLLPDDCLGLLEGDGVASTSCYSVSRRRSPWREALATCRGWGGSLVSINSAAEDAALEAALRAASLSAPVWIGANDLDDEGTFAWANGDPFLFERFAAGEPNDALNLQDCIERRVDGSWGDRACTVNNSFICELALAPRAP